MACRAILGWFAFCAVSASPNGVGAAEKIEGYAELVGREKGLVCWQRFEGDLRDARGAADGQAAGGEARFVAGPGGGKAVALAGKRFVTMGPTPKLDVSETTVELWFRPTFQTARYNPCLVAKRAAGDHTKTRFSIHVWADYSCMAVWNGRAVSRFTPAVGGIEKGRWHHLAVTSKPGEMRMFLNGTACLPEKSSAVFTTANKGLPMQIGSSTPTGQEWMDCEIDELAVYNRVLRPDQIAAHTDAMGWKEQRLTVAKELARRREAADKRRKLRIAELNDPQRLFAPGGRKTYRGDWLEGISFPVGGIGTGLIQMDGKARLAVWQIFNNYHYAHVPHSFLAVRTQVGQDKPVVRALQTEDVGPFEAMEALTFQGEYPFGWYTFEDPALPVKVSLEVHNPLIPGRARESGMPCAVFLCRAENTGRKPVTVTFLASQQNAVGYLGKAAITGRLCKDYGQNVNRVVKGKRLWRVHLTGRRPEDSPGAGDMVLTVPMAHSASATASWQDLASLHGDLSADGSLTGPAEAGPSAQGATLDAAVADTITLEPGRAASVVFVLAWHFPNGSHGHGKWGGKGCMYQNWWPDAMAVSKEIEAKGREYAKRTRLYHNTLYRSNLPHWLIDRIANQVAILRTQTCFWTKEGYFGGWEGCCPDSGCCHGNCSHVWHYAQSHARLFPSIARRMREQEFGFMAPDGSIPFRQPRHGPATDGQCGSVLNSYREHLMSADDAWLERNWPAIKKAMDFVIRSWDTDEDGVMDGRQWNTLDCAIDGSSSWLGSLYLAALGAAERMATARGAKAPAARYRAIRESGMARQDESLFNGEYYIQLPGKTRLRDYLAGCHIDQMLGQWWAHQLDLGWLFPRERVRSAMRSLVKYNFRYDFHGVTQVPRKFVADDDAGMQMIRWPKGGRPPAQNCMLYGDEVMTGFEYAAAGLMIQAGMLKDGFRVARAIHDRYDGRKRTGLTASRTASWGWSGNPFGDDECGKFYARAMSNWSLLLACQGAIYDGPAGRIGFAPVWRPDDHKSFFTVAKGFGLFTQTRDAKAHTQTERIELAFGELTVRALVFQLPPEAKAVKASVTAAGRNLRAAPVVESGRVRLRLDRPVTLRAGQTVDVLLSY